MAAVLARGVRGDLVEQLQAALTKIQVPGPDGKPGPALSRVDGDYGRSTQLAVQKVQSQLALPITGTVDQALWKIITRTEWPGSFERHLGLLAAFEGHGYTKAAGNWDKAGITWGVIGFTLITHDKVNDKPVLKFGPLRELLKEAFTKSGPTLISAFGEERAKTLKSILDATPEDLYQFAVQVSDGKQDHALLPEWQKAFAQLGQDPAIRELQREFARRLYYEPALKEATEFGKEFDMASERTVQLFFDIQVNNGGLGRKQERPNVKAALKALPAKAPLTEKLNAITQILAKSRPRFAKDILERKGTISNGFGRVHGKDYRLDGWGIEIDAAPVAVPEPPVPSPTPSPPAEPLRIYLGILSLEPVQQAEQIDLVVSAKNLGWIEPGVELLESGIWPGGNEIEVVNARKVKSLSLRGLLADRGKTWIGPKGDALLHGINLMFREPVGILAVMGQSTPLPGDVPTDHLLVGREDRHYIGLNLRKTDELHLVRQRTRGKTREESLLDITEIRPQLAECRILMLYAGFGVPGNALPGSGVRWREWLAPFKASPIVLGWFGNVRLPRDAARQVVASDFLTRIVALQPGADFHTLCANHPDAIVQKWGEACHDAFHAGAQKYLWRDQPIEALDLSLSGAAAIGQDGRVWHANPMYGATGEAAMKVVTL